MVSSLLIFTQFSTHDLHWMKLVFSMTWHVPFCIPHWTYLRHLSPMPYISVHTSGGLAPQVTSNPWQVCNAQVGDVVDVGDVGAHVFAENFCTESSAIVGVYWPLLITVFFVSTKKHFAETIGLPDPSWINAIYQPLSHFSELIDVGGRLLFG